MFRSLNVQGHILIIIDYVNAMAIVCALPFNRLVVVMEVVAAERGKKKN